MATEHKASTGNLLDNLLDNLHDNLLDNLLDNFTVNYMRELGVGLESLNSQHLYIPPVIEQQGIR